MEETKKSFFKNIFSKKQRGSNNKQNAKHELKELCIHFVFVFVTTVIAMSSREIGMYYFNQTIERLFLNRLTFNQNAVELSYEDLVTVDDWWSFAETTFVESIAQFELRGSPNKSAIEGNILIGPPRLRQIRVKNESCRVHQFFQNEFETCYGHYSKGNEDVGGFLNTTHSTQSALSTFTIWGSIAHYHGSGYIQMLTIDKAQNEDILIGLKDANWIDRATRVILMEFALFNADVDLFCNVKLLAEIPATGGIATSSNIQALRYSSLWNDEGYFVPFCAAVFLALIIYYTIGIVLEILSNGCVSLFGSVFNLLDMAILMISYFSIIYVIWHAVYLKSILDRYSQHANQYFSLDIICFWNLFFIDTMGMCVFIVWIKTFKYIKFNKTMMQFSTTLQRCAKDLLGFSIMFLVVFVAYAHLSVLWFGSLHSDFCDFPTAVLTLMRTVLGDFDYEKLEAANRVLGPIFFLSFILFVFFVLMNMFLAIINDTYSDVKSEITQGTDSQFGDYLRSLLTKLRNCVLPTKQKDNQQVKEEPPILGDSIQPSPSLRPLSETKRTSKEKLRTRKEILDSLSERVTVLEDKLERLVEHLDDILNKVAFNAVRTSNRSL